jgi:hypothetical protein
LPFFAPFFGLVAPSLLFDRALHLGMVSPFLHVQIEKGEKIVQKRWEYKKGRKMVGKMVGK